jgi:hypothetical protein
MHKCGCRRIDLWEQLLDEKLDVADAQIGGDVQRKNTAGNETK